MLNTSTLLLIGLAATSVVLGCTKFYGLRTNPDSCIVGGENATLGQYPFMVSLTNYTSHRCGATILNRNWILTAAHCVPSGNPKGFSIKAGVVDLKSKDATVIPISEIILHEGYHRSGKTMDDIALMKLSQPLEWNEYILPVVLPRRLEQTAAGTQATMIGWGRKRSKGYSVRYLQTVDLNVISDEQCRKHYPRPTFATNICTGSPEGAKSGCKGDSGGPLLANGHQVGVASRVQTPCDAPGRLTLYAEVSHYIDWINSNMD